LQSRLNVFIKYIQAKAGRRAPDEEAQQEIDDVLDNVLTPDLLSALRWFIAAADGNVHDDVPAAHPSRALSGKRALLAYFGHWALAALGQQRVELDVATAGASAAEQAAATTRAMNAHYYAVVRCHGG
jgi:hypothetical protein